MAVLILKEGKKRRVSTAVVTRSSGRIIDNRQSQQKSASPTPGPAKPTDSRTQPVRISSDNISDEERKILPRITAQLQPRFSRRIGGPPIHPENRPTPSTSAAAAAVAARNIFPRPREHELVRNFATDNEN